MAVQSKLRLSVYKSEQKDKAEPFDVEEVLQEMPREQREALWRRLASLLQDVLLEFPTERWEGRREEEGMQEEPTTDSVSKRISSLTPCLVFVSDIIRILRTRCMQSTPMLIFVISHCF